MGARVWSQRAPRHTWGRRGEVIKALAFPQGVSPTRVPDSLVLPSLGAERAHGPEWGLRRSVVLRPGRRSVSKDRGSVRDQRQGSPRPHTADPWLLRNPPASSKVLGWGRLHSLKSSRRHCTAPRDRTKPAPCLKRSVGLLQLLAASTSTHTLSLGQETISREDVAEG